MATSDVKTPRSSKRKAAEALLEASLRDVQEKRDAALQSKLSEPCTRPEPQAQLVKRRKHGSSSALPFPATPQQSAEQKTSWRDICSSLTSCDLSVLVRPDATEPQQLSLTRTGATVLLVDQASQVPAAVELLRASMHDPILGIDLEWQADFTATQNNPVSLLQIASASCCLLVRSCCMKHKLPAELLQLFRDASVHFIGLAWSSCDEGKFQRTFGCGRSIFGKFSDLQELGNRLGYHQHGIASFCEVLLQLTIAKSKKIARSNWAARSLSVQQVKYAALDAFLTGMVFRAMGELFHTGNKCKGCKVRMGIEMPRPALQCSCGKSCTSMESLLGHAAAKEHDCGIHKCLVCGRLSIR